MENSEKPITQQISFMPKNIQGKTVSYEIFENGKGGINFNPAIEQFDALAKTRTITLVNKDNSQSIWSYTESENQFIFEYDNGADIILNLPLTIGQRTESSGTVKVYENDDWVKKSVTATNTVKAVDVSMKVNHKDEANVLYIEQQRSDLETPAQFYFVKDKGLLYAQQGNFIYCYPSVE